MAAVVAWTAAALVAAMFSMPAQAATMLAAPPASPDEIISDMTLPSPEVRFLSFSVMSAPLRAGATTCGIKMRPPKFN